MDYGDIVYDCLSAKDCRRLQTVQNCDPRIVKGADRRIPSASLHSDLNMTFLSDPCHMHCCNQIYKTVNGLTPDSVSSKFDLVDHSHHTRSLNHNDLVIPDLRLDICSRNFIYRVPMHWNLLDMELKSKPSINSFKQNLCKSNYFTPVAT